MEIFAKLKKSPKIVWRDATGEISCPGDDCPQTCDESCPIWCQTKAIMMLNNGLHEQAIDEIKKALSIALDFKEAWVNMAAIYGEMNNHMEANKAYMSAHAIDPNYKNAIFGLIISCKNLGQFDEALKYCDEYAQKISKVEAENLRKEVLEMQKSGIVTRQESAVKMAFKIIEHARKDGLLPHNTHFQYILEIMLEAKRTCQIIHQDMIKDEDGQKPMLWLAWGAYAGMGAVWHWNVNWNDLKAKGIAETLLEPRGSFAMDEYVIDAIGIHYDSPEGNKFWQDIYNLSQWTFMKFINGSSINVVIPNTMEAMQAMYLFGMVYEMERLGMR